MIYSLLVMSPPASGSSAATAARFAQALIEAGHSIRRVFFLDEGVTCASSLAVFPQDESSGLQAWVELAERHGVDLVLCVSSALRYGMLDNTEAERHERPAASIHPSFTISGLGQLVDASVTSDRLVTFGG